MKSDAHRAYHEYLLGRMADVLGVDLALEVDLTRLSRTELLPAINRCAECPDTAGCALWLDAHSAGSPAAPPLCRNKRCWSICAQAIECHAPALSKGAGRLSWPALGPATSWGNAMIRREWRRFVNRGIWSWAGWRDAWGSDPSLRFRTTVVALSSTHALDLPLHSGERRVILPLGVLVLAAELMNTAVERVVDLVSPDRNNLARRAKDAGSAAVALTAMAGGLAWALILWRVPTG